MGSDREDHIRYNKEGAAIVRLEIDPITLLALPDPDSSLRGDAKSESSDKEDSAVVGVSSSKATVRKDPE